MKLITVMFLMMLFASMSFGRVTGNFKVNGDSDKFYPVTFQDGAWNDNVPTKLWLGRSNIHTDSSWLGALVSKFTYHVSVGGHGANFISGDIMQSSVIFIAGWKDVSSYNNDKKIVIWLKGGGITYYYNSNFEVNPVVYDGVTNSLPYNEPDIRDSKGVNHNFKVIIDEYVNTQGISYGNNAYFNGLGTNSFAGKVGIGTTDTKGFNLAVNGKIRTQEIRVENANWPDFVFEKSYSLPTLKETEKYIKDKGHLPGIPSAEEVKTNGIDLGEMNAKLLQKIEELTLHLINQNKEIIELRQGVKQQDIKINLILKKLNNHN